MRAPSGLCFFLGLLIACGGAPQKVTITTHQEYEKTVGELIDQLIENFTNAGINCEMITSDLKSMKTSPKLTAVKDYGTAHPDAKDLAKAKVETRRADIEKAAAPGMRQCQVQMQPLMEDITK